MAVSGASSGLSSCSLSHDFLCEMHCSAPVFSPELRVSMSTDTSEGPHMRRKVWKGAKAASCLYLYRPLSPDKAAALGRLSAGLEPLYELLEGEMEAFSLLECKSKTQNCQLAAAPTGSSLLKRRGLALTVSRA